MNQYYFAKKLYRKKTFMKYEKKLLFLGIKDRKQIVTFLNTRLVLCILIFSICFICFNYGYVVAPIFTALFHRFLSYLVFDSKIKVRSKLLEKEAIYYFEIVKLVLDSEKSLVDSLKIACKHVDSELSREIQKSLNELGYGKSFHDAFSDLRKRIPSDILDNVILNFIDAHETGLDIRDSLQKQIDYLEKMYVTDLKKTIGEIPFKISMTSIFFFIPFLLLLVLSPMIVRLLK